MRDQLRVYANGWYQGPREAVGPNVDLLIEAHDRFSVSHAIRIGNKLAEFDPMWLETPVQSSDIAATIAVARQVAVPIATGERFSRTGQFVDLLAHKLIDIVQPEVLKMGLGNIFKVCGIAEAAEALVACHQAQSPLCTAINAHLHAAIPNFLIHENFDDSLEDWTWDVLQGAPRVVDGGC